MGFRRSLILAGAVLAASLAGCAWGDPDSTYPEYQRGGHGPHTATPPESVFGPGGLSLFGADRPEDLDQGGTGIGVNSYLWRASLDTIAFMPLASADPFGGVIITDLYSDPTTPTERFKATVYILDTRLRADALNVSIFRQQQVNGAWNDATVDPDTEIQIENAILTRARQLRLSTVGN